jgi:hypothetical protein
MRYELDKSKLKKIRIIKYQSFNDKISKSQIKEWDYEGKPFYQPEFIDINDKLILCDTAYTTIEVAKYAIDNYNGTVRKTRKISVMASAS